MKKYFAVAKILFKAQMAYRFDVILTAMGAAWRIVFAWILWNAIYAGRDSVGGFTLGAMLTYYVITAFLATMDLSGGVSGESSARIREGTFSKYMVIPTNPRLHFLSQSLGASAYYGMFALIATAACSLAFKIYPTITTNPACIVLAVALYLVGTAFMNSYQLFVGLWAFKFQEIGFMLHILPSIVMFIKGEYVPLSLLPDGLAAVFRFTPFTHTIYTPAMLLMGRIDLTEGLFGLSVLAVWTLAMSVICEFSYHGLRKKYEGVGI